MSKFLRLLVALATLSLASKVSAIRCWTCKKAITNDECNARGSFEECPAGESCVSRVISANDGSSYEITKGCRTGGNFACKKERNGQNAGTYPMHCQYKEDKSVCQCCCATDSCNWPHMECKDVVTCRKPDPPGNGRLKCPKSITFGSKCIIKCNKGFRREGPRTITCSNGTSEGKWTPEQSVACLYSYNGGDGDGEKTSMVCKQKMKKPAHGSVVCENSPSNKDRRGYNYVGSSCAFKCDRGYFLKGQEGSVCLPGGQWSTAKPECVKATCQAPIADKYRKDDCTDGNNVDSVCVMSCRKGYRLEGSSESTCQSVNEYVMQGRWSEEFPKCVKAECRPALRSPNNGAMACTNGNLAGSICTYTCDDGFDLTDTIVRSTVIKCVDAEGGLQWTQDPPRCQRITCERLDMPENGIVTCSGDGRVGSKCKFSCNPGYDLVGVAGETQETECKDDGDGDQIGTWSLVAATCAPITCKPERTDPENGKVYCTDGNNVGSICTYVCDPTYDMDDTVSKMVTNVCTGDHKGDGDGKWSAVPASCSQRFSCDLPQVDPVHGSVSCSDDSYLGSECQFACEEGYEIAGLDRVVCTDLKNDGDATVEWSAPAPTCVVSTCPVLWYDTKTLTATCSSEKGEEGYPVGTTCNYDCSQPGFYLEWSGSGKDKKEIKCIKKNTWSQPSAPRCVAKTCSALAKLENGNQPKCTNGNKFNSVCTFQCAPKYRLSHSDSLVCDGDGEGKKSSTWDKSPPSCILSECLKEPTTPNKGTVTCSSGAEVGSYCTLTCDRGFAPRVNRVDCVLTPGEVDGVEVKIPKFRPQPDDFCCAQCRSNFRFVQMVDARFTSELRKVVGFTKIFVSQLAGQDNEATFAAFKYNDGVDDDSVTEEFSVDNSESVATLFNEMQEWEIEEEGLNSDTQGALNFANDVMFSTVEGDVGNFLIVTADDAPNKVSGVIRKLQKKGVHVMVAASNNFAKIKWERVLGDAGTVFGHDANVLMAKVYELAFKDGCSNLANTCV